MCVAAIEFKSEYFELIALVEDFDFLNPINSDNYFKVEIAKIYSLNINF